MFYKYLNKATFYFEYGSGGSTYKASTIRKIKKILSVESDIKWHNILKSKIKSNKIKYILNDMDTIPNKWGSPGPNATKQQKINYSSHIKKLNKNLQQKIDLVFIDGRFRLACCLKCLISSTITASSPLMIFSTEAIPYRTRLL